MASAPEKIIRSIGVIEELLLILRYPWKETPGMAAALDWKVLNEVLNYELDNTDYCFYFHEPTSFWRFLSSR